MSHSILVYEHGGPEVMRWEEIPPQHPGRGEVLIDQKKHTHLFYELAQLNLGHTRQY